jgi:hypothetical protein
MARFASIATQEVLNRLQSDAGLAYSIAALSERLRIPLPGIAAEQLITRNVAAELAEKTAGARYPAVHIYCERVHNDLREKFRTFSGTATMCIEVRISQDRMEGIEEQLQYFIEAVTEVLDSNRGTWPNGMFFGGGYEVTFSALKHGGKNFLQSAKVRFELNISSD